MKNLSILILSSLLFISCFKEENERAQNNDASVSIKLGEDYLDAYYYNLSTQSVVAQHKYTDWNLAFYAQEDDFYIKLNHAANMKAYPTNANNMKDIKALDSEIESIVDNAKGDRTKIALQYEIDYTSNDTVYYKNKIYILDLGSDALGENLGYKKIKLNYTYLNNYNISFARLEIDDYFTYTIAKNVTYNYVYFSFANQGEIVAIEPDKTTWDLLLSRSTDITVTNDSSIIINDYSVTSVLLNPFSTEAYLEKDIDYTLMQNVNIVKEKLTSQLNIIGYNWKAFDLDNTQYSIRPNQFYVLKDINDFYYKLKFVGFYDPETNLKGTISFEYEIIK